MTIEKNSFSGMSARSIITDADIISLMLVVIGLGNPGKKYEKNRHNVGFMVVDALSQTNVSFYRTASFRGPNSPSKPENLSSQLDCDQFQQVGGGKAMVAKCRYVPKPYLEFHASEENEIVPLKLVLVKPQMFMNESGKGARFAIRYFAQQIMPLSVENGRQLVVIHDDLDLPLGQWKLQFGKGPKIHNGLLSMYRELGANSFWHLRVGVDGRGGDRTMPGSAYVLQNFSDEEKTTLEQVITQEIVPAIIAKVVELTG
jgi:peptidyl-tRNA hydrolase, PTH1 family